MIVSSPNLKNPRSLQWNLDIQRALTNNLALDVAYVGTHGYNEIHSVDLNEPALGTGWDSTAINNAACLPAWQTALSKAGGSASQALINGFASNCKVDTVAIAAGRPYAAKFPYFLNISQSQNGFRSNYNALQVTLDKHSFHARCGDLLLDSAIMNGVELQHDCRSGICGACRVRLVDGKVFGLNRPRFEVRSEGIQTDDPLVCS